MRQVDDMGAVYLAAENNRVSTHTAALVTLDRAVTIDQLRDLVRQRLHLLPPFHWRLAPIPLGLDHPYWVEADVDLELHVTEAVLPPPGDDDQLRALVERIFARPLDRSRPLWEMSLIRGLPDDRVAALTKVHHAIADGLTGVQLLGAMADPPPGQEPHVPPRSLPVPPPPGTAAMLVRGLAGLARQPLRALAGLPLVLSSLDELPVFGTLPGVRLVSGIAGAAARRGHAAHVTVPRSPRTSFNRRVSGQRRVGFGTLRMEGVLRVKTHFGVTVNDVVMATAAGALRHWLTEHAELPRHPLTAVVPVSTRSAHASPGFGNRVSAVVVPIPTDEPDATDRLVRAHETMRIAKAELGTMADALVDVTRFVPPAVFGRTAQLLTSLNAWSPLPPAMNVNISNVPGPRVPLYYCGARVESLVPLAGITDGLGLNITVLSYCDRIDVGIVADRVQVPDAQRIADWMTDELADLVKLAD